MPRIWGMAVLLLGACSFDEHGAAGPRDAAPLPDALPAPDAPPPDCGVSVFPGFADGGAAGAIFDCSACGCVLDDFIGPALSPQRWKLAAVGSWQAPVVATGGVTLASGGAVAGDYDAIFTTERFYLDGDFDLLFDFDVTAWQPGWDILVYVLGPAGATSYEPTLIAGMFDDGAVKALLQLESDRTTVPVAITRGTFEISRINFNLCVQVRDAFTICRPLESVERCFLDFQLVCTQTPCAPFSARFAAPRLRTGRLVAHP